MSILPFRRRGADPDDTGQVTQRHEHHQVKDADPADQEAAAVEAIVAKSAAGEMKWRAHDAKMYIGEYKDRSVYLFLSYKSLVFDTPAGSEDVNIRLSDDQVSVLQGVIGTVYEDKAAQERTNAFRHFID